MKHIRKSFSAKIILSASVGLIVSLTASLLFFYSAYIKTINGHIQNVSRQQVQFLGDILGSSFQSFLSSMKEIQNKDYFIKAALSDSDEIIISNLLDGKTFLTVNSPKIKQALINTCLKQHYFINAYYIDEGSASLAYAFAENDTPVNYEHLVNSEWYTPLKRTSSFYVSSWPFSTASTLACIIPSVRNLNRSPGHIITKISGLFLLRTFASCDYPYGDLYCVNSTGSVLYTTAPHPVPNGSRLIVAPEEFTQVDDLIVYRQTIANSDLSVLCTYKKNNFSALNHTPFFESLILALVVVTLCMIIVVLILRHFLKPLRAMANIMSMTEPGNLQKIPFPKREDEIGILEDKYNDMTDRINTLIETQYQTALAARDAQIRSLQFQINPHFVNNTLQMIGAIAAERNMMDIYSLLCSFSRMFYYSLRFKRDIVLLKEELNYLEDYLAIQHGRFPGKFSFMSDVPESMYSWKIPKMILQPIIENTFSHAFQSMKGGWKIHLSAEHDPTIWRIIISDNGSGFSKEQLASLQKQLDEPIHVETAMYAGTGIGLKNVNYSSA